jgi:hypothetical protein
MLTLDNDFFLQFENENYSKEDVINIIKQYKQLKGSYLKPHYINQLPNELKEYIIQYLPYYPQIQLQSSLLIYKNTYCQLPVSKYMFDDYIKNIKNEKQINLFVVGFNVFHIYRLYVVNGRISTIYMTIMTKTNKITLEGKYIIYDYLFFFNLFNQHHVILDVMSTVKILNKNQAHRYGDIKRMMLNHLTTYFNRKPTLNHIDQAFYNMQCNIYIMLNYGQLIIPNNLVFQARFDQNGIFTHFESEQNKSNYFIPTTDPINDFNVLLDKVFLNCA